jgi:hypothetical protein
MSAVAQLQHDILELEAKHDRLVREIDRKYAELDQVRAEINAEAVRLAKIRAEIVRIKSHFGV